jgi:transcriptional regulator with XRE-family HTH domain
MYTTCDLMSTAETRELGQNLRHLRERRGLTQAELGTRAGMAAASVSHFETGQRLPSLDSLVKLADALEVSVDTLLGRTPIEEARVDPIFLRASRADAQTLTTLKRLTVALLEGVERDLASEK